MKNSLSRRTQSFREISNRFLQSENQRHFLIELLLFATLAAMSVWPLVSATNAIETFVR
jgi:hypothetical protein